MRRCRDEIGKAGKVKMGRELGAIGEVSRDEN